MQKILEKLHKIMSEVDYIQKDKTNTAQNYNYASEYAIKDKLHSELVKNKIVFSLSADSAWNTLLKAGSEKESVLTTVLFSYSFLDVESGERLDGKFIGSGKDSGDKGVYKAITGAIKYILTSTFLIPTGDDPEEDGGIKREVKPEPEYVNNSLPPQDADETFDRQGEPDNALKEGSECPNCPVGKMKLRRSAKGQFLGCSAFPDCRYTSTL